MLTAEQIKKEISLLNGKKRKLQKEADSIDDTIVGLKEELRRRKNVEEQKIQSQIKSLID